MGDLVKWKASLKKTLVVAVLGGSVVCFILFHWVFGLLLLGLSGYLLWDLVKFYAKSGKRF